QRHVLDLPDRSDVLLEIEVELFVERHVDGVLRVDDRQGVPVCRLMDHVVGGDVAGGAGPRLDNELLVQMILERLCYQSTDDVGGAAGRLAYDHAHRTRRISALCARDIGRCRDSCCGGHKLHETTAMGGHGVLPDLNV